MNQEQYEKESRERNKKLEILYPMCGLNKLPKWRFARGSVSMIECSKKELFMRREYERIRITECQADAERGEIKK